MIIEDDELISRKDILNKINEIGASSFFFFFYYSSLFGYVDSLPLARKGDNREVN